MNKKKSIFWAGIILAAGAAIILSLRISKDARIDPDSAVFNYRKLLQEGNGHHLGLLRKTLYKQLRHNDLMVRMNVAEVMGELDDPGTIKKLWRITVQEKTPIVREAAVEGMCLSEDKRAIPYLRKLLWDDDVDIRRKVTECYYRRGWGKESLMDLYQAFIEEKDELNKIRIAVILGSLGDKEKLKFILDVLRYHMDYEFRDYVAAALSENPTIVNNIKLLNDIFSREVNDIVRIRLALLLAKQGDEEAVAFLKKELAFSKYEGGKIRAAKSLSYLGRGEYLEYVYPFLMQLLEDDDWSIREMAVETLNRNRDFPLTHLLSNILETDAHPTVREVAAWAMGERRDPEALLYLEKGLHDPVADVRTGVLAAIYKILKANNK